VIVVDTHAHIFENGLELAAVRRYAPTYDARVGDYLSVLDSHGVACGVLLQPSFLGTNNDYMIAALRAHRSRLRGIAVVDPRIAPHRLDAMDADGVVGIRLNLQGLPIPDFSADPWPRFLAHVRRLDWQVEIHRESHDLPYLIEPLLAAGVTIVVDHFGRPDGAAGVDDLGFRYLLLKGASRRIWVKLSGGYRNWPDALDQSLPVRCAALLLDAYGPERLVWGSDWPHTQNEKRMDFGLTQRRLEEWVPKEADRRIILQDSPLRLFRFGRAEEKR
jgi:predicted TIM-barrel fold metal-dependent hydrolase